MSTTTEAGTAYPTQLVHCMTLYEAMRKTAQEVHESEVPMLVWEGFLTRLVNDELKLSVPYYTMIKNQLLAMGCMRQLRRGGGNSMSQWELIKKPTLALWNALSSESLDKSSKPRGGVHSAPADNKDVAALEQRLQDLVRRVDKLDQSLIQIVELFNARVPPRLP